MNKYNIIFIMIRCLLLTIVIESLFAIILGVRKKKDILNIILANIVTNPLVVSITFAMNFFYGLKIRNIAEGILEIVAVLVEGLMYHQYLNFKKINPFVLSLGLNIISYGFGIIYNLIFY